MCVMRVLLTISQSYDNGKKIRLDLMDVGSMVVRFRAWTLYFAGGSTMTWATPSIVEICIGLEINGYLPAEF
jgi:coenzyme PQQ precursor peptide PqqA